MHSFYPRLASLKLFVHIFLNFVLSCCNYHEKIPTIAALFSFSSAFVCFHDMKQTMLNNLMHKEHLIVYLNKLTFAAFVQQ